MGTEVTIGIIYGGVCLIVAWLAIILWTYRDMRARSRDTFLKLAAAIMVGLLTIPGLIIYLFLRPRETLSEAYERSLEEEALLQEIEETPNCPGCGLRVQEAWQICAYCHTQLKRPCINCNALLELAWNICPVCATPQGYDPPVEDYSRPAASQRISLTTARSGRAVEGLEFIDEEDYST
jgi:hypothetical protein